MRNLKINETIVQNVLANGAQVQTVICNGIKVWLNEVWKVITPSSAWIGSYSRNTTGYRTLKTSSKGLRNVTFYASGYVFKRVTITFTLQGSNNNSTWFNVGSQSYTTGSGDAVNYTTITTTKDVSFKYLRVYFTYQGEGFDHQNFRLTRYEELQ